MVNVTTFDLIYMLLIAFTAGFVSAAFLFVRRIIKF